MSDRVLFVDDEANVLEGIRRTIGRRMNIATANGPQQALQALAESGPFAVVVSDMRMPGMSGALLLAEVERRAPETVRMILSGQADFEATIAAVNDGHIFRFLTKPCAPELLLRAVDAALDQYRLVRSEKELLEQTLVGSIQVLTDILGVVNPDAYGRATRLTRYADILAHELPAADQWQIHVAAMLSQVGWVTMPEELVAKVCAAEPISPKEQTLLDGISKAAAKLISPIPRLHRVAAMLSGGTRPSSTVDPPALPRQDRSVDEHATSHLVDTGHTILQVALLFDQLSMVGTPRDEIERRLAAWTQKLPPRALDALCAIGTATARSIRRAVTVKDLAVGMVIDEDVLSSKGLRLTKRGQEVTHSLLLRLRSCADGIGVIEPINVRVPN